MTAEAKQTQLPVPRLRPLAKELYDVTRKLQSEKLRLGAYKDDPVIAKAIETRIKHLEEEAKQILEIAKDELWRTRLWKWCRRVKGLGPTAALAFAGFVNPYVSSAGKAKSYIGACPGKGRRRGQVAGYSFEGKGLIYRAARAVIMAKDPYYYPLLQAKYEWYLRRGCCERHKPGEPGYKAHCWMMAIRWLVGLLVSHAWQLQREDLGLDVSAALQHRNYIPPKPENFRGDEPWFERILENLRNGKLE